MSLPMTTYPDKNATRPGNHSRDFDKYQAARTYLSSMAPYNTIQTNPSPPQSTTGSSTVHSPAPDQTSQSIQEYDVLPRRDSAVDTHNLQANRMGNSIPGLVDAFMGVVTARGYKVQRWDSNIVVMTPNPKWVPEFAVAHSEITTFSDGRWGQHKYSRWPQQFAKEAFHVHCILSKVREDGPHEILWRTLSIGDWKVDDLWHTVDRLCSISALPTVIVSLAAHVQQLTLELYGLIEWLKVMFKWVKSVEDYTWPVLEVVGAYTEDPSVTQVPHCAGVPVWLEHQNNTRLEIYKVVTAQDIPDNFSQVPSYPRLVLAKCDLSGPLNLPGEWRTAMTAVVRRQLCESWLPELLEAERDEMLPPVKHLHERVA
ncbi:hypothetical protein V8D89_014116 [Ganoderma adspersum]